MYNAYKYKTAHEMLWSFSHSIARLLALVLLLVTFMLPVAPVFASEIEDEQLASEEVVETEEIEIIEPPPEVEEPPPEEILNIEETEDNSDISTDGLVVVETIEATTTEPIIEETEEVATTTEDIDVDPVIIIVPEPEATTTPDVETSSTTPVVDVATSTESASSTEEVNTEVATSTDEASSSPTTSDDDPTASTTDPETEPEPIDDIEISDEIPGPVEPPRIEEEVVVSTSTQEVTTDSDPAPIEANIVFNDENKYRFTKDQCVSVGDGTYYCTNEDSAVTADADGVYAAMDSEGDREIYIRRNGEEIQITDNLTDDDAPFYDEVSNTIVWHRLVEGRYQIIEYDLEKKTETQLTTERYNNMQPTRHGDMVVWQGWVGNDWEILLDADGELTMLTDNTVHDISPRINGDHIIWQSFENEVWRVKLYDTLTGSVEIISDSEGGSVENPRFVLVYDTKFDNGDVETKGYDLDSGELVPLSSTPAPVPQEIPDPEQTGEERALVQPPVQIKTKTDNEFDTDDLDFDLDLLGPTATSSDDVIITPFIDEIASSTEPVASSTEDIIVVPHVTAEELDTATTSDSGAEEILDIIITPFVEPIATTTDSQATIATST